MKILKFIIVALFACSSVSIEATNGDSQTINIKIPDCQLRPKEKKQIEDYCELLKGTTQDQKREVLFEEIRKANPVACYLFAYASYQRFLEVRHSPDALGVLNNALVFAHVAAWLGFPPALHLLVNTEIHIPEGVDLVNMMTYLKLLIALGHDEFVDVYQETYETFEARGESWINERAETNALDWKDYIQQKKRCSQEMQGREELLFELFSGEVSDSFMNVMKGCCQKEVSCFQYCYEGCKNLIEGCYSWLFGCSE